VATGDVQQRTTAEGSAPSTVAYPRRFGRYTLLSPLAEGGMGALHLACQGEEGMEKLCVIKTVLPHLADKEYVARFRDEAKVVVRLSHGNLVPVFDASVVRTAAGDELYLAMEHIAGKDLRAVWNRCAKKGVAFPVDIAVYIAREVARGLYHAHSAGAIKLVHRDVSPPNILLSFSGEVKLTDFGLAASTLKTEKTSPGIIYGKVSYMSPEQARGEQLDGRTDLYAVGVILWELLTGRQLFPQGEENLIVKVRDPHIEPPSTFAPRVPPALDLIVMKALARDRTLRYLDCEAFRAALAGFLAQHAPTTDNERVARFLDQLFDEDIVREQAARQELLDKLSSHRGRVGHDADQTSSQPTTVSLQPQRAAPAGATELLGAYLDARDQVRRLIGEGGMGLVYEAEHTEIGRRVAVKVLHAAYTRHAEVVARFRAEARAATRIGHPHIVEVLDSGTTVEGAVYFVMEFLAGQDLSEVIRKEGPQTQRRTVAIGREICQALAAAHRAGIVHRDMKPENVFLIEREGHKDFVKVLDFGIAKTLEQTTEKQGRLTQPGMAMGTPEYMAPEQAAGQATDLRADIYSVGAILYEMLTGKVPIEGANVMEILTKKATTEPLPVGQLRADVDRDLERLVMRMLARSPEQRPQSMDEVAGELGRLTAGSGGSVRGVAPVEGTLRVARTRMPLVVALVLLSLGGITAGVFALRHNTPTTRQLVVPPPVVEKEAPPEKPPEAAPEKPAEATPVEKPAVLAAAAKSGDKAADKPAEKPIIDKQASDKPHAKPAAVPVAKHLPPPVHPLPVVPAPVAAKDERPSAKKLLVEARHALGEQRFAQAEALFGEAQAQGSGPDRGAALTGLGEVAFQRGNYPEALKLAKRASDGGGGVGAKVLVANCYYKLKRWDDAIAEYNDILRLSPGNGEARSNLAAAERQKLK